MIAAEHVQEAYPETLFRTEAFMRLAPLLLFFASFAFAQDPAAITAAQSACGPVAVNYEAKRDTSPHALAQPLDGKALVYVIQDIGVNRCVGSCLTVRVGMDGAWVGANEHNSYFSFSADPGEHHLCVNRQSHFKIASQMVALAHFTAEPGKIYYFRARTHGNETEAFLDLDPIDSDQGRLFVASYPLSVSHPKR
jgi:hypothetical protein